MSAHANPLDRRYSGEHPVRTVAYLLSDDKARLALGVVAFAVKHSPTWLLPLVTANVIDAVVQHRPIGELWFNTILLLAALSLNYPFHDPDHPCAWPGAGGDAPGRRDAQPGSRRGPAGRPGQRPVRRAFLADANALDFVDALPDGPATVVGDRGARLSTIRDADRIVVMRDGRIEEVGPHDELSRANGAYTRLQVAQPV